MNIILGATGQVGSLLAAELLERGEPVRAVIRDASQAMRLESLGMQTAIADYRDIGALTKAFQGGHTAFLITPEKPDCTDCMAEVDSLLDAYREAVLASGITRIVGLSSLGAQHEEGTGNLMASYRLEHAFEGIMTEKIFVRPAYYFSNWLGYLDLVRSHGILPTFFPPEMELPMVAPPDVASYLADLIQSDTGPDRTMEIVGPKPYNRMEIARIFGEVLGKAVSVQQVQPEDWESSLREAGFSEDGARNLADMTQAVVDGKTSVEKAPVILPTDFRTYLESMVR
ncbi:MAG TPA: NAD(P)H-binding protein [Clostridiaceae bacterium]|nr:NAD(P)H-binding protein [Clostridiaceae bacterium]